MKRKKRIESILLNNFSFLSVKVEDISVLHQGHNNFSGKNETHFKIILQLKAALPRLQNGKMESAPAATTRKYEELFLFVLASLS